MIEIVKQNETYRISETADNSWVMTGTAEHNVDGSCSVNFSVTKPGELMEDIGSCSYYKPAEQSMVSVNYNVTEANRDEFVAYTDTVIDAVLAKFAE